jgi:ubiquinone/menaquinone biosynthesis C-methylase UbiE
MSHSEIVVKPVERPSSSARSRRGVRPEDASRWVFNRIADVYSARPAYPGALVDDLARLAPSGGTIGDIGAGTGHVSIPLAERGYDVVAVEPAEAMMERLRATALSRGVGLRSVQAKAEALPLPAASLDLAVVADALHFLDVDLASRELFRVLLRRGRLAVITVEFADTPYMRAVTRIVEEESQRRLRRNPGAVAQLFSRARVPLRSTSKYQDHTEMDTATLERVLRSISFVGPAMNQERFARFRERVLALDDRPVWSRAFTLHEGRKAPRARAPGAP